MPGANLLRRVAMKRMVEVVGNYQRAERKGKWKR